MKLTYRNRRIEDEHGRPVLAFSPDARRNNPPEVIDRLGRILAEAPELLEALESKADRELEENLRRLFGEIESFAYVGLHSGKMDHVPADKISFNGYANASQKEVWPPSIVSAAKQALFEGLKRSNRERFIRAFIEKVESVNEMANP